MNQRDNAIRSIRRSLKGVRYRTEGDGSHITGICYGLALGKASLARALELISAPEYSRLVDLTINAADQADADQRRREANHG